LIEIHIELFQRRKEMDLNERLSNVSVLGAGGKMGSGISLLIAQEMALQKLNPQNRSRDYHLNLIDINADALSGLKLYLQSQANKFASKNIEMLRSCIPQSDDDYILSNFAEELLSVVNFSMDTRSASKSLLVFEAVIEKIDLKVFIFKELKNECSAETFFLSNTSSIPIKLMDEEAGLQGRIIGYHFYNPPAVQKLVEVIIPEKIHPELKEVSYELGKRLGKILIPSNDVAGFIGNGHFTRDGLHAISEVQGLHTEISMVQAIYFMNRISQDFLLRPMGIFQLIDYVGIDVYQSILNIMNPYFDNENFESQLIDRMVKRGVMGGQYPDRSQKNGFLKYENYKPAGVYDPDLNQYVLFSEKNLYEKVDNMIGEIPEGHSPWKSLLKDPDRDNKLRIYFENLKTADTLGASLALQYLKRSKEIGEKLLTDGVANKAEDVNGVLMNGFFHLYGPINEYV
jgi:3-hydroxyacyl-CoA dehydrogenase